jgi:hypothetical protein
MLAQKSNGMTIECKASLPDMEGMEGMHRQQRPATTSKAGRSSRA